MEFFSTFGGNTVSCAVGLAVLDVLRDEGLQAHALRVGERLLGGLRPLVDVTRSSATCADRGCSSASSSCAIARRSSRRARRRRTSPTGCASAGILLGTDGPYHNVVKIRPPMPFSAEDADLLVDALDRALGELTG